MTEVATRIADAGPQVCSQISPARSIGSNGRSSGLGTYRRYRTAGHS